VHFRHVKPETGLQGREAVNRAGIPGRGGEGRGGDGTAIRGRIIRVYAGWFIHINVSHCEAAYALKCTRGKQNAEEIAAALYERAPTAAFPPLGRKL